MPKIGIVVGTGYSLKAQIETINRFDGLVFTCNNTYRDIRTDVWLSCDPSWHALYSPVYGDFKKWHWDSDICSRYAYKYVEGVWVDGLWMQDKSKISLNHCSGAQLLNLACNQYECDTVLLVGHDFHYDNPQRHYFDDLSETPGEYPKAIRKHSKFIKDNGTDDLLAVYKRISETPDLPTIINCTPESLLPWFPRGDLRDYL